MTTALATVREVRDAEIVPGHDEYQGLTLVTSPAEALRRMQELQAFVTKVMVTGVDYGTIPGTDKPTLLQPGAQKLAEIYGFSSRFVSVEKVMDWQNGFFYFEVECQLTSRRDGRLIGNGMGSCNSKEDRYAWRWVWEKPAGTFEGKTRKTRTGKTQWRVPNEDVASLVNTIQKMACKRALVHAVIGATRSSGVFTQDVEDLPEDAFGEPEKTRSWDKDTGEVAPPPAAPPVDWKALVAACQSRQDLNALYRRMYGELGKKETASFDADFHARAALLDKAAEEKAKLAESVVPPAQTEQAAPMREPGED